MALNTDQVQLDRDGVGELLLYIFTVRMWYRPFWVMVWRQDIRTQISPFVGPRVTTEISTAPGAIVSVLPNHFPF